MVLFQLHREKLEESKKDKKKKKGKHPDEDEDDNEKKKERLRKVSRQFDELKYKLIHKGYLMYMV